MKLQQHVHVNCISCDRVPLDLRTAAVPVDFTSLERQKPTYFSFSPKLNFLDSKLFPKTWEWESRIRNRNSLSTLEGSVNPGFTTDDEVLLSSNHCF